MKPYIKIILLFAIPLAMLVGYALSSVQIGQGDYELEKVDLSGLKQLLPSFFSTDSIEEIAAHMPTDCWPKLDSASTVSSDSVMSTEALADTAKPQEQPLPIHVAVPDSGKLRLFIFGDSMLEWLARRLCDYTMENGYDLSSVIWYSSSTKLWAETDTLQFFLDRIQPDYVLLCLGSNELFVRDLQKREPYIATIVQKLQGRPFVWISPPNWKEDSGINNLIIQAVGPGRYFDSRSLDLERSSDGAHPTREAAAIWADTIASWLNSTAPRHPLRMARPTESRPRKFHQYVLKPVQ